LGKLLIDDYIKNNLYPYANGEKKLKDIRKKILMGDAEFYDPDLRRGSAISSNQLNKAWVYDYNLKISSVPS